MTLGFDGPFLPATFPLLVLVLVLLCY